MQVGMPSGTEGLLPLLIIVILPGGNTSSLKTHLISKDQELNDGGGGGS